MSREISILGLSEPEVICCLIYHWLSVSRQVIYYFRFALVKYPLHDWSKTSDILGKQRFEESWRKYMKIWIIETIKIIVSFMKNIIILFSQLL